MDDVEAMLTWLLQLMMTLLGLRVVTVTLLHVVDEIAMLKSRRPLILLCLILLRVS